MALDAKITKRLDSNHVQVDVTSKNQPYRYFKLPNQTADSFVKNFKKQDKKNSYLLNGAFISSIIGGVCLTGLFTKKIKSSMTQYILKALGGTLASVGALTGMTQWVQKQDESLTKKYHAEEIYYET